MAWPNALLELMKIQRRRRLTVPDAEVVGGRAILTTISQRGIQHQVLHCWPDEVGEPVDWVLS
jgi:hypothetical protein